jgi:hypothetical protein
MSVIGMLRQLCIRLAITATFYRLNVEAMEIGYGVILNTAP